MRNSLRLHIFVHLILISLAIILINRWLAQYLITEQLTNQVNAEMSDALVGCWASKDESLWTSCLDSTGANELTGTLQSHYILCHGPAVGVTNVPPNLCGSASAFSGAWALGSRVGLEHSSFDFEGQNWLGVRFADDVAGPQIWLSSNYIDHLLNQMWRWRDQNLVYVLPAVFLLLTLMAVYMTYLLLRPLRRLEASLSKLSLDSPDEGDYKEPRFKEFESISSVFKQMRTRLRMSFTRTQRFASDASHELRTPLSILRGTVQQLIDESPDGGLAQVQLRTVGDEIERMIEIVEKLLLLSRADANELSNKLAIIDLSELLRNFVENVRTLQTSTKIGSRIEPDIFFPADQLLLTQLMQNLFSNAINYNVEGGRVLICLKSDGDMFELTLENTAQNLPDDMDDRVFERFYRGDIARSRRTAGVGLGLSICAEIARVHRATITLKATQTNTVIVTLRAKQAKPVSRAQ